MKARPTGGIRADPHLRARGLGGGVLRHQDDSPCILQVHFDHLKSSVVLFRGKKKTVVLLCPAYSASAGCWACTWPPGVRSHGFQTGASVCGTVTGAGAICWRHAPSSYPASVPRSLGSRVARAVPPPSHFLLSLKFNLERIGPRAGPRCLAPSAVGQTSQGTRCCLHFSFSLHFTTRETGRYPGRQVWGWLEGWKSEP